MLNFLFLVRQQTDDVVFLVEQESILYMFSVAGECINHSGCMGLVHQQQYSYLEQVVLIELIHIKVFW